MNNNQLAKEKEAGGVTHQPLQDHRAATLTTQGDFTSEAAVLQEKMKEAAKEFASLNVSNRGWIYEPEYRDQPFEFFVLERFLPYVHCTPEVVLFRLRDEWIRLTEENLENAMGSEENAKWWLAELRKVAKKYGDVSWTLPKLQKGGLA
jgi:hypothetical protein